MKRVFFLALTATALGVLSGCATWDRMSAREKAAVGGAAVGGVVGAAVSDGGVLGPVGGAAIGGLIGDQIGK
mgnify:CR=1 FL=1